MTKYSPTAHGVVANRKALTFLTPLVIILPPHEKITFTRRYDCLYYFLLELAIAEADSDIC